MHTGHCSVGAASLRPTARARRVAGPPLPPARDIVLPARTAVDGVDGWRAYTAIAVRARVERAHAYGVCANGLLVVLLTIDARAARNVDHTPQSDGVAHIQQ